MNLTELLSPPSHYSPQSMCQCPVGPHPTSYHGEIPKFCQYLDHSSQRSISTQNHALKLVTSDSRTNVNVFWHQLFWADITQANKRLENSRFFYCHWPHPKKVNKLKKFDKE